MSDEVPPGDARATSKPPSRKDRATGSGPSRFQSRVYDVVRRIPEGRVTSYGAVAALAGKPRAARGVGWALSALPEDTDVPWWRVVNRLGEIRTPRFNHLAQLQKALLKDEDVEFTDAGRIPMDRFGWDPHPED